MAGQLNTPGFSLQPAPTQSVLPTNYITDFDFLNQYLPDTYEAEFERYGNRSVASLLRRVSAELPSNSDLIKWSEHGRLHIKYTNVTSAGSVNDDTATLTIADAGVTAAAIRPGQTIMISDNTAASTFSNKAIVTAVNGLTLDVAFYEGTGQANYAGDFTIFVYGSEFKKGSNGMGGSLEANPDIYENSPIIIKDTYTVSGSDMAQIGWIEVSTENGASGYLWYIKSEHENRLRFDDYLETSMIEAVPAEAGSGAIAVTGDLGNKGSEGYFYVVGSRGQEWSGGVPTTLGEWDTVVVRMDKNGAIEENVVYNNRTFSFAISDMLADQSTTTGASYGLFDNDENMALNLMFSGFRRGYDFYQTDWKYLNDVQMRGGLVGGSVNGTLIPAGSMNVYDEVLGKNAKRPYLHVRYRASETTDRRYQTKMLGMQAPGGATNDLDALQVEFLSERALCTMGANNFFVFTA